MNFWAGLWTTSIREILSANDPPSTPLISKHSQAVTAIRKSNIWWTRFSPQWTQMAVVPGATTTCAICSSRWDTTTVSRWARWDQQTNKFRPTQGMPLIRWTQMGMAASLSRSSWITPSKTKNNLSTQATWTSGLPRNLHLKNRLNSTLPTSKRWLKAVMSVRSSGL